MSSPQNTSQDDLDLESLPPWLRERVRRVTSVPAGSGGTSTSDAPAIPPDGLPAFVMYWMRSAVRSDENPALEVAIRLAHTRGLPLLVYHGLSDHYPYASDRHHQFMLEGARDVQRQFSQLNLSYAFHLATVDDRQPRLTQLAAAATVVVTEDMPVDPPRRFLDVLRRRVRTPLVVVDTSCVVPMQLVPMASDGGPQTRAYQFRSVTRRLRDARVGQPWPVNELKVPSFPLECLPFRPLDLHRCDLDELVARCQIDHSVPPVRDTVGGSTAGYRRWAEFLQRGLDRYDKRRNDPLQPSGVSRLSPYLHYGMVSPFRIARQAAAAGTEGAEKYLDELLIWRELAYHFCFHRPDHDQWSAVPDWARRTLHSHQGDRRATIYSWEALRRGKTEDALWNAAQQSLLLNGELHNNVRMTWGKGLLQWSPAPEVALRWMIDLNHRFALDGRDPSSYGGILWCLGQFDRPFVPERPVLGSVRPRESTDHARRLDVARYRAQVEQSQGLERPRVAVIGAGIAGLSAARTLVDHGCQVHCFEKSRGVAGRMSTRQAEPGVSFDHGAQYFTARNPVFQAYLDSWCAAGIATQWPTDPPVVVLQRGQIVRVADSVRRYVGVPGMTAIGRHLAQDVPVSLEARVERVAVQENSISLFGANNLLWGEYDHLIVALPAPQAAELLSEVTELNQPLKAVSMRPCWAVLMTFAGAKRVEWAGAFVQDSPLSWIAWTHTKPGRNSSNATLVLHATPEWTIKHWETPPDVVGERLVEAFWEASGGVRETPLAIQTHRWRYALPLPAENVAASQSLGYLRSATGRIVACGDWSCGGRVEGAFLSGLAAAGHVLRGRNRQRSPQTTPIQLTLF